MPKRKQPPVSEAICPNPMCSKPFSSSRGLSLHISRNPVCSAIILNTCLGPSKATLLRRQCEPAATSACLDESQTSTGVSSPNQSHTSFPNYAEDGSFTSNQSDYSIHPPAPDFGLPFQNEQTHPQPIVRPLHDFVFTDDTKTETSLLNIMLDIGAPLNGFQKIMKWAKKARQDNYTFLPTQETYQSHVAHLKKSLEAQHYQPYVIQVDLPGAQDCTDVIDVVVFDFVAQLFALLSDPRTNQLEFLVTNPNDPFAKYTPPDGILGEMMSGEWYSNAWDHMTETGIKNFLIPIILYIDKTVISESGKLSIYPVTMSLGIFSEKARRNPLFWRPLGYISNQDIEFSGAQQKELSADIKNQRLHNILFGIFDTYIKAQSPDAMNNITIQLGPSVKNVNLYLPLAYIIGDIEGGNQLTGYRGFSRLNCPRISQTCDCHTMDAYNFHQPCNRIR
jgi:Plavaka transposase